MAYQLRGRPSTGATHAIIGAYADNSGGGVLEWCFSREDAERLLEQMLNSPEASREFKGLTVEEVERL